uniref:SAM domain-containing protein n=1 Tax=Strigamia maritima TaxID=126957 RepID=T1JCG0_STRMM
MSLKTCLLCFLLLRFLFHPSTCSTPSVSPRSDSEDGTRESTECVDDSSCADKLGFDAIMALHRILDDDANGAVDVTESDEFLREELQYENGYERRHNAFHLNDKYISVKELWESWKISEVHNWTVEETIEWLVTNVELPQYVQTFQENGVDGTTLPRLAVNNMHFITNILGIKDPIHKQKIVLKAMDVVLFGTPKLDRSYFKNVALVTSLIIAIGGCWFAYLQHKYSQQHLKKMMKDMDNLQKAEDALETLQAELHKAIQEQETAAQEKKYLEEKLQSESIKRADSDLSGKLPMSVEEISRLKLVEEELRITRQELNRAEKQLEDHRWLPPPSLQHWLQLTHEIELKSYNAKKGAAEMQLSAAKEGCEKLRRKRSSLMGAFRIAHGNSIDDVDSRILQAKAALTEVTQDLKERLHRWRQIEVLCGFSIVQNTGLIYLQSALQGSSLNGGLHMRPYRHGTLSSGSMINGSQDDLDDLDSLSTYAPSISADSIVSSTTMKRSRSTGGPDMLEPIVLLRCNDYRTMRTASTDNVRSMLEEDSGHSTTETNSIQSSQLDTDQRPHFALGGDSPLSECLPEVEDMILPRGPPPPVPPRTMVKSFSQDHSTPPRDVPPTHHSKSDSALDVDIGRVKKTSVVKNMTTALTVQSSLTPVIDDETNSTDSGSMVEDEMKKEKKKRFSLHMLRRSHKQKSS